MTASTELIVCLYPADPPYVRQICMHDKPLMYEQDLLKNIKYTYSL